jgi:(p)ppGpp synthase/HD superfamily hydrolase
MTGYSPRFYRALVVAAQAHRAQVRKGTDVPYIVHPAQVAIILFRHGFDEDLAIAGALHDTVEDCDVSLQEIQREFGDDVAALVDSVTEKKSENGTKRPWRVRKEEMLAHLAGSTARTAALKAADALHNAACTLDDVVAHGPRAWDRFNAGAAESIWYYREVSRLVSERLGDHELARELADVVEQLAVASRRGS